MSTLIEIPVNIGEPDEVTFFTILQEIEEFSVTYKWSILCLEVIGELIENQSNEDFEEKILSLPDGLILNYSEIKKLFEKVGQVIWMTLIASADINKLKRLTIKELFSTCEIVISILDGDLWVIYSKNDILIKKLSNFFKISEIYIDPLKSYPFLDSL